MQTEHIARGAGMPRVKRNKSSQTNLGRARRSRTTTQQSPHWFQWDATHLPPKLPLPLQRSLLLSNTPIHRQPHSSPQTASDPVSRFSRVHFPHRHRPTDRHTHTQVYTDYNHWSKTVLLYPLHVHFNRKLLWISLSLISRLNEK